MTETQQKISDVCDGLKELLLYKNEKYGNSALEPLGIFSKLEADNSICIRLDDKLSRIKNSDSVSKADAMDIAGYLILLAVHKQWYVYDDIKE